VKSSTLFDCVAVYLAVCLFAVRFFDTFFEVPHQALAPELVRDYDGRTNLLAMRHFFMVLGGLGMTVLAYQVFLRERPDGTGGVLARDGYFAYSVTGALIIFGAIVLSTLGTADRIPYLTQATARKITLKAMVVEIVRAPVGLSCASNADSSGTGSVSLERGRRTGRDPPSAVRRSRR